MVCKPSFVSDAEWAELLANGRCSAAGEQNDLAPVTKLFTPDANATWLIAEVDPTDTDRAFGLCDLGVGMPELGYVSLAELNALRGPLGLPIERDACFAASTTLADYGFHARAAGRTVA
jgi:hypothetical protein